MVVNRQHRDDPAMIVAGLTATAWKRAIRAIHDRLYADLVGSAGCGAFDGGCLVVARALQRVIGGEIKVLVRADDTADHAVVEHDGRLWDYDGPLPPAPFIARFNRTAGARCVTVRPLRAGDLAEAHRDDALVGRLADLLRQALNPTVAPDCEGEAPRP